MKHVALSVILAVSGWAAASANEFEPAMRAYFETQIATWVNDPAIVAAIVAQNARTADFSADTVQALDQAWRAEVGTSGSELVNDVLQNPAADFLRQIVTDSGGTITEVFIMDSIGLNVAASAATSDYWQGDEEKFTLTYPTGAGTLHFGEVEFDESSQSYQGQISIAIADPETNQVIGAMTVGVNADALF